MGTLAAQHSSVFLSINTAIEEKCIGGARFVYFFPYQTSFHALGEAAKMHFDKGREKNCTRSRCDVGDFFKKSRCMCARVCVVRFSASLFTYHACLYRTIEVYGLSLLFLRGRKRLTIVSDVIIAHKGKKINTPMFSCEKMEKQNGCFPLNVSFFGSKEKKKCFCFVLATKFVGNREKSVIYSSHQENSFVPEIEDCMPISQ